MVVMLVLIAAVVVGVVWLIVAGPRRSGADRVRDAASKPEHILAERLARGEIDVDEYRVRLAALREQSPRT
jgi:putative membrane protein